MSFEVKEVGSRGDMRQFIGLPLSLYTDDPRYVPPLLAERKEFLSDRNPAFDFTHVRYLLARDDAGLVLGRTTAHVNSRHNEFAGEQTGFFGFFECVDDFDVARLLMVEVERWLAEQGMDTVRGPFNFSTNHECGFLTSGFDTPPAVMMPHTKPYYPGLFDRLGYRAAKELVAYDYTYTGKIPEHLVRFGNRVQERSPARIRTIDMSRFEQDVTEVFSVYNRAWSENWGFVPMTAEQFAFSARSLKRIVDPEMALIAEIDGEPVGFFLALPDINVLLKHMNGRLFPFGFLRFLLGRRRIKSVRVITLGVVKEHRNKGIDSLLACRAFQNGARRGYKRAEFSWILEDNVLLRRGLDRMGAVPYKTYRIYEKSL